MSTLQRTAALNTYGVRCLTSSSNVNVSHYQKEGMCSFRSALATLSGACANPNVGVSTTWDVARPLLNITVHKSAPITAEHHFFYMTCEEQTDSYEAYSAQSCVLLFNLALALHQRGTLLKDEVALRKAAYLYEHSLEILALVADCLQDSEVVTAEALKNLADIYSEIGNVSGLRCVLDALVLLGVRDIISRHDGLSSSLEHPAPAA